MKGEEDTRVQEGKFVVRIENHGVHNHKSRKGLYWIVWARCFPYRDYPGWGQKRGLGLSSIVLGDIMKNWEIYI